MKNRKMVFISVVVIGVFLLGTGIGANWNMLPGAWHNLKRRFTVCTDERQVWMTVFVHGSFGSLLGMINLLQVVKDDVQGTVYKKIVGKMRKHPYFYQDQPLLQRGLIKLEPTFDLKKTDNKKYAAYPIAKAYEEISEYAKPCMEENVFYTYGWSGLLSQKRRCFEAVRFYNALSQEIAQFHAQGIHPKIRIIGHSHGGNLAVNLAAVHKVLKHIERVKQKNYQDKETLSVMRTHLDTLGSYKEAQKKKGQRVFDFYPERRQVAVDELILFGTPIQPENEYLFAISFFKKVYNIYSDEDVVQGADWVSTKQFYSEKRIDAKRCCAKKGNCIVQMKIMTGQKFARDSQSNLVAQNEVPQGKSFWEKILGGLFASKRDPGPTHKDLWFLNWNESDRLSPLLHPFPILILTSFLTSVVDEVVDENDVDINIYDARKRITFEVSRHGGYSSHTERYIPAKLFTGLKKGIASWRADDLSPDTAFTLISNFLNEV